MVSGECGEYKLLLNVNTFSVSLQLKTAILHVLEEVTSFIVSSCMLNSISTLCSLQSCLITISVSSCALSESGDSRRWIAV